MHIHSESFQLLSPPPYGETWFLLTASVRNPGVEGGEMHSRPVRSKDPGSEEERGRHQQHSGTENVDGVKEQGSEGTW